MIAEVIWGGIAVQGPPLNEMVKAADSVPVMDGFEEMILISYPEPEIISAGIVKFIVPVGFIPTEEVLSSEPIEKGTANVPDEFDN
jgi:hypothetical protein